MRKTVLGSWLLILLAAPALAAEAPKKRILFGIQTGQQDVTYAEVKEIWKEAHVIMNIQPPYDKEMLRRFAAEVMPRFR